MPAPQFAIQAYKNAALTRPQRLQEADVFNRTIYVLKAARNGRPIEQIRALADNRRLWSTVVTMMRDPTNALPAPLRASIISVGLAVQRNMDGDQPDFDFLISVNESMAAGLSGRP